MITLDIITLIVMLAAFIVLLVKFKLPSGISLMAASVAGLAVGCIIHIQDGLPFDVRYLIEGGFGYIDNLLVIVCAMVFIKGLESNGGLDYITAILVKLFRNFPTLLLLVFMAMLLLPGMVTGSSTAAVVSVGIIITPILIRIGMPKAKVAAFVGFGAILGMVAPPINIPVMVICDVVDIAYSGFDIPLLLLTVPMALIGTIFFSRDIKFKGMFADYKEKTNILENIIVSALLVIIAVTFFVIKKVVSNNPESTANEIKLYNTYFILIAVVSVISLVITWLFKPHCNKINISEVSDSINFSITKEIHWTCLVPLALIVVLFIIESAFPKQFGALGTPLLFIIAFIPSLFTGKRFNVLKACDEAVERSLGVLGLLMGVGMFIEVMTVTGARGLIVANILKLLTLSNVALYIALGASLSIFGGISSFASASVFGGPFVMVLYGKLGFIIVASACSLIAALGEFLPPTAMSSRLATKNVNDLDKNEELGFMATTKAAIFPLAATLTWAMIFIIICGKFTV